MCKGLFIAATYLQYPARRILSRHSVVDTQARAQFQRSSRSHARSTTRAAAIALSSSILDYPRSFFQML